MCSWNIFSCCLVKCNFLQFAVKELALAIRSWIIFQGLKPRGLKERIVLAKLCRNLKISVTALMMDLGRGKRCNSCKWRNHIQVLRQSRTFGGAKVLVPGTITMVPPPCLEGFLDTLHPFMIYNYNWKNNRKEISDSHSSDWKKNELSILRRQEWCLGHYECS